MRGKSEESWHQHLKCSRAVNFYSVLKKPRADPAEAAFKCVFCTKVRNFLVHWAVLLKRPGLMSRDECRQAECLFLSLQVKWCDSGEHVIIPKYLFTHVAALGLLLPCRIFVESCGLSVGHGISNSKACGILRSPTRDWTCALQGGFLTIGPPGSLCVVVPESLL